MDGFGLIAKLRQRSDTSEALNCTNPVRATYLLTIWKGMVPIIIVTAKESEEARVEGLLSGADECV